MSIDLSRFHQTFFAESFEQLDAMEAVLLAPGHGRDNREAIDTLFRAAHSVKGGSATFGFDAIAGTTHHLETLLDEVRDGRRQLDRPLVDLLLESVDVLRLALAGARDDELLADDRLDQINARLSALYLEADQSAGAANDKDLATGFSFSPHADMFRSGNDPLRLLREVADLADFVALADLDELPAFSDLDPESCYLSWSVSLSQAVPRGELEEIFEWVEHDCDLTISTATPAAEEPDQKKAITGRRTDEDDASSRDAVLKDSIRVDIEKVDLLIDQVGELLITESRLESLLGIRPDDEGPIKRTLARLKRHVRALQESALQMRMIPISFAFNRLPRMTHDLNRQLDKQTILDIEGATTEVDKSLLERLTDPLIHLVRNAIDHGVESSRQRESLGKPAQATINVRAYHKGGNVVVEVEDDGRGLDLDQIKERAIQRGLVAEGATPSEDELMHLIFSPGFTTAQEISDVSGRGVGLDVVRQNIQSLGGQVLVDSEDGLGTRFTITLPLTLSIIDGQLARIGQNMFVIPLLAIVESRRVDPGQFEIVGGSQRFYRFRGEIIPELYLASVCQIGANAEDAERMLIVVEWAERRTALLTEALLSQQQVVVKSVEANFRKVSGISGATILGDGSVALILDVPGLGAIGADRRRKRRPSDA